MLQHKISGKVNPVSSKASVKWMLSAARPHPGPPSNKPAILKSTVVKSVVKNFYKANNAQEEKSNGPDIINEVIRDDAVNKNTAAEEDGQFQGSVQRSGEVKIIGAV